MSRGASQVERKTPTHAVLALYGPAPTERCGAARRRAAVAPRRRARLEFPRSRPKQLCAPAGRAAGFSMPIANWFPCQPGTERPSASRRCCGRLTPRRRRDCWSWRQPVARGRELPESAGLPRNCREKPIRRAQQPAGLKCQSLWYVCCQQRLCRRPVVMQWRSRSGQQRRRRRQV